MPKLQSKVRCPVVWQVAEMLVQLKLGIVGGEKAAQYGGNILQPLRVILLCSQTSNACQVAKDEEHVFDGEQGAFQHVLQS